MTPLQQAAGGDPIMSRRALERTRLGAAIGRDQGAWDDLEELLEAVDGGKTAKLPDLIHDAVSPRKYGKLDCDDWNEILGEKTVDAIHELGHTAGAEALAVEVFNRPAWVGKTAEDMGTDALQELSEALGEGPGAMQEWDEILSIVRRSVSARQTLAVIFEDDMELEYDPDDMEKNRATLREAVTRLHMEKDRVVRVTEAQNALEARALAAEADRAALAAVLKAVAFGGDPGTVTDAQIDVAKRVVGVV